MQGDRGIRKMQSTERLVGCTEVSGCRRADSSHNDSGGYNL